MGTNTLEIQSCCEDTQEILLEFTKLRNLDITKLTTKNCELFEIWNKLDFYSKRADKPFLIPCYSLALELVRFIAIRELE